MMYVERDIGVGVKRHYMNPDMLYGHRVPDHVASIMEERDWITGVWTVRWLTESGNIYSYSQSFERALCDEDLIAAIAAMKLSA